MNETTQKNRCPFFSRVQVDDCWPAANGWSLIDYYAMPKPAYYSFKRGAQSILCCLMENENNEKSSGSDAVPLHDADAACRLRQ